MIQVKTTAKNQTWGSHLRVRVGETVTHNGGTYVSVTGINSEPGTTNDFEIVKESESVDVEFIVIDGVSYNYVRRTEAGTKDVPVQYDEAIGGITDEVDEDSSNPIKIWRSFIYNTGDPSLLSSWWKNETKQLT